MINHNQTGERAVLANRWIAHRVKNILDAGCDDGNNTFLLSRKAEKTWGIDVNQKTIEHAQQKFPSISFLRCPVEKTGFEDNFFDVIIMNDVLEHVENEIIALNEMFRILKKGGQLIISTPHQGMFAFLDPANLKFLIKSPALLRLAYGNKKAGSLLVSKNTTRDFHRHYSLKQLQSMLDKSSFSNQYTVEKVFRSGLLLGVLSVDLKILLKRLSGSKITSIILYPLFKLASLEYWIPFGPFAYNISVSIRKNG